jgi:hypothetical protein
MTEEVSEMRSEIRNSPSIIVGREVRGHVPKRPTSNKGWKDLGSELSVAREDIVVLWRAKIQTTPSQKRTKDEVEKRRGYVQILHVFKILCVNLQPREDHGR